MAGGHFGSPLSVVALPDKITLPNITIEDFDTLNVYQRALKPIFDAIWNAAGYPKSQSFDQDGNWAPERA